MFKGKRQGSLAAKIGELSFQLLNFLQASLPLFFKCSSNQSILGVHFFITTLCQISGIMCSLQTPFSLFFFAEICGRYDGVLGVEIRFKRVWLTANKARRAGHANFRVVHHHSGYLGDLLAPGELSGVFINHPDPWPKDRHHKHRLLQPELADLLAEKVEEGGEIWIQSDFTPYGPLAQEVFGRAPWQPVAFTADLHGAGSNGATSDLTSRPL